MIRRSLDARPYRVRACDLQDYYCRNCSQVRSSVDVSPFCLKKCPVGIELREIGDLIGKERPKAKGRPRQSRKDGHLPPLDPIPPDHITPETLNELKAKGYTNRTISEAAGKKKYWIADKIVSWKKRGLIS